MDSDYEHDDDEIIDEFLEDDDEIPETDPDVRPAVLIGGLQTNPVENKFDSEPLPKIESNGVFYGFRYCWFCHQLTKTVIIEEHPGICECDKCGTSVLFKIDHIPKCIHSPQKL